MKMKQKWTVLVCGISLGLAVCLETAAQAQVISITGSSVADVLQLAGLSQELANNTLVRPGVPFAVTTPQGTQSFLISTNAAGRYVISTSGPGGAEAFTPPANSSDALTEAQAMVAANNPSNITFYATNEIDCRVGMMYLQNSGQAVAALSVQKYGLFGQSNIGVGGGVLEGNNNGKQGTAGYYGELDYRKPIGDVAVVMGAVGGYDNWNSSMFGGVKAGLEYRQSAHLGEWVDVSAVYENSKNSDMPFLIGGGITYAF